MFRRLADPFQLFGTTEDKGRGRIGEQLRAGMRGEASQAELVRQRRQSAALASSYGKSQTGVGNAALQARQGQQLLQGVTAQANAQAQQARLAEQERARAQYGAFLDARGARQDGQFGRLLGTAATGLAMYQNGQNPQNQQQQGGGNAASLAGLAAMFCDEATKEDAAPVESDKFVEFLDSIAPTSYRYKKDFGGEARVGFMAQDIEGTEIGATMVETGDDGLKRVKMDAALSALMATASDLHKRVEKVEAD